MQSDLASSSRWWLRGMYALLIASAVSLGLLLLGDLVATLEAGEHADGEGGGELHHLFIFDLAWPGFLVTTPATLVAGLVALIRSRRSPSSGLTRFSAWALGYVALAVAALFVTGALEL